MVPREVGNRTKISKATDRQLARLQETGVWLANVRKADVSDDLVYKMEVTKIVEKRSN